MTSKTILERIPPAEHEHLYVSCCTDNAAEPCVVGGRLRRKNVWFWGKTIEGCDAYIARIKAGEEFRLVSRE